MLTDVTRGHVGSVEHEVRAERLARAEDSAERGQSAREQPRAGRVLLCERLLRWTHLLAGADAGPTLAAFRRVGSTMRLKGNTFKTVIKLQSYFRRK